VVNGATTLERGLCTFCLCLNHYIIVEAPQKVSAPQGFLSKLQPIPYHRSRLQAPSSSLSRSIRIAGSRPTFTRLIPQVLSLPPPPSPLPPSNCRQKVQYICLPFQAQLSLQGDKVILGKTCHKIICQLQLYPLTGNQV
jgi:hypothetical protein